MKEYSSEDLLIEVRKKHAATRPIPGELVQAIAFAFLSAEEKIETSKNLLEEQNYKDSYVEFLSGLEELGKIRQLANSLREWKSEEHLPFFLENQKRHTWKIKEVANLVSFLNKTKSVDASIEKEGVQEDISSILLWIFENKTVNELHQLRMELSYVEFDGKTAYSQYHRVTKLKSDDLTKNIITAVALLKLIKNMIEKLFPVYWDLLQECYFTTEIKKIKELKCEINRRVDRAMPAMRKIADLACIKIMGFGLDEINQTNRSEYETKINDGNNNFFNDVATLIISKEEIEDVYFYPPMKDHAREFYLNLEKEYKKPQADPPQDAQNI